MHDEGPVRIPQEVKATPGGMVRIAIFAALSFATAAWMVGPQSRTFILLMATAMTGAVVLFLLHVVWQTRYGQATLTAASPFEIGRDFHGVIVTELSAEQAGEIRLRISGWSTNSGVTVARAVVDPTRFQRSAEGSLRIPFYIPASAQRIEWMPREVRLHARTTRWPLGWGATFLVARSR